MHTLTHEGGHVLGASHDQSQPKSWIRNDPGSLECLWKEGYIMSYVDGGAKHHRFSHCSLRQIRNVIIMRGRSCWTVSNTAHTNQGKYPGMEVAPNAFCKNVFPDKANVTADMNSPRMRECMVKCQYAEYSEVCYYGRCRTYVKTYFTYEHALDYMYCGDRQVCVQGVCGGKPVTPPPRPAEAPATQKKRNYRNADTKYCKHRVSLRL
uniref:Reprolysin n=1 Tax=Rhipicephalus zambeziensis TaxID=60191 RepID=A0A224YP33_9ACAR